jgi:hypothetical protein
MTVGFYEAVHTQSVCSTACTNMVVCGLLWDAATVYVILHGGEDITSYFRRLSWTTLTFCSASPLSMFSATFSIF